jgi:hypothetical protein
MIPTELPQNPCRTVTVTEEVKSRMGLAKKDGNM